MFSIICCFVSERYQCQPGFVIGVGQIQVFCWMFFLDAILNQRRDIVQFCENLKKNIGTDEKKQVSVLCMLHSEVLRTI
jgi:hypothetical protein